MQRRAFVLGSAAVAGGVVIGGLRILSTLDPANPLDSILDEGQVALTPYVIIDGTGVSIVAPRAEMGQGIHSTLAALVAEELDVPLADVRVIHGPASAVYANNIAYPRSSGMGTRWDQRLRRRMQSPPTTQLTGGQSSTQDAFVKMRKAGAAARAVLVEAASRELGADPETLRTENGVVVSPDGSRIPYARLASLAGEIEPPEDPALKPRDLWMQLGVSQPRVDMVEKCTGTSRYSIDVRLPEMLYGVVRLNPRIGSPMVRFDASKAETVRGFRATVRLDDGVVAVATNTWYAMQAAALLDVEWGAAFYPSDTAEHRAAIVSALDGEAGRRWRDDGDVEAVFSAHDVIEGTYHVPYLAHATMEPLNAVAWFRDGELDLWAGNQNPTLAQREGARITGLPLRSVRVHTTYMGGGFGRRLEMDFVRAAVHTACAMPGTPVQVMWPREEDFTHDVYRPMASARFRASMDSGRPVALAFDVSSPGLFASSARRNDQPEGEVPEYQDKFSTTGVMDQPYDIENYRVTAFSGRRLLPVGWWRSVGESQNTFFHESAIDELAHAVGRDPLEFRLSIIRHPQSRAVLEAVAKISDWGSGLPPGRARGVAYALSSGAATAQVVEVTHTEDGVRIERSFAVVDVGIALDPRNIEGQVMSSVIFGLCAARHGEITVTDGRVDQTNYDGYPIMRIHDAPPVEVMIHESGTEIYGVGESGTATAAPALGNAIFAATGIRIRELPFKRSIGFV